MTDLTDLTDAALDDLIDGYRAEIADLYRKLSPLEAARHLRAIAKMSDDEKHRSECHPDWEYATTTTGRKTGESRMPEGDGWEPNARVAVPVYKDGEVVAEHWRAWDRFDLHENEYWKRRSVHP